jgi:miniconductance mechanosensitive channel
MIDKFNSLLHFQSENYWYVTVALMILIGAVILVSVLGFYIARHYILRIAEKLSENKNHQWIKAAYHHHVFHKMALLIPGFIIYISLPLFAEMTLPFVSPVIKFFQILTDIYMVMISALIIAAFLNSIEERYNTFKYAKERPIKSYLQVTKMVIYILSALIIISILLDKSLTYFITGIGAMTAVIAVIFKDSILGFTTSIQLASYDMARIGDWIEVPNFGADGIIIDISLNTIKVQNFDNSIVMMPSYALLTGGFRNWRGMKESGGRRIKRAVYINASTIKFCDEKFIQRLKSSTLMQSLLVEMKEDGQITNIKLLRLYLEGYLSIHPDLRREMPLLVRELEHSDKGVPLELYIFTLDTTWENYEHVQADIFDHIYAILELFDLKAM